MVLENRLKSALANLRAQIRGRSESEKSPSHKSEGRNPEDSLDRAVSLNRARELHKMLMNARTREADLQDEVDRMKSEMAEDRYRIEELEGLVDEGFELEGVPEEGLELLGTEVGLTVIEK